MDWSNERYVRLYVRETVGDVALSWQARAIWKEILPKCDRAGVIGLGRHGLRGLAGLIRIPREIVEEYFQELIEDGRVRITGQYLIVPNYIEAQEATQSDRQRAAESRSRRREKALLGEILSQNVTENHETNPGVTFSHSVSHDVTPYCAVPCCTVPNQEDHLDDSAHARDPKPKLKTKTIREKKSARAQTIEDWNPNSKHEEISKESGVDLLLEAEKFRDYVISKPNKTYRDFDAAFRNWLRNARSFNRNVSGRVPAHIEQHNKNQLFLAEEWRKAKAEEAAEDAKKKHDY